ncbi:hypothetical protein DYB28_003598 [Aphanomyces astaci]|uniref:Uncharacterized protein n=1 Tax=Aphanomyces astaci TaxID=112090 RepID=A0A9X8E353_APHAT|nr:hypothetical protein DYB28_003598 [Aphanomyces astaci]
MKLLAALVHAAAAASQAEVVFDSLAPLDKGDKGSPISKARSVAVQFPRFPASHVRCSTAGLTLEYVNFTLGTLDIPTDESLWMQTELCPSETFPSRFAPLHQFRRLERIPIQTIAKRVTFQVFPPSPIVLEPATTYWFTVRSNGKTKNKSPIWLDGTKTFSTKNDPSKEMLVAYTEGDTWAVAAAPNEDRFVPSLQVYASKTTNYLRMDVWCPADAPYQISNKPLHISCALEHCQKVHAVRAVRRKACIASRSTWSLGHASAKVPDLQDVVRIAESPPSS